MSEKYMELSVGDFLNRNKNLGWAIFGIRVIFSVLVIALLFGGWLYFQLYAPTKTDIYLRPFKEGFEAGVEDGYKDSKVKGTSGNYLSNTPWYKYIKETKKLKALALKQKEEFLLKFSKEERDKKRAEMALNGFKTTAQLELEKGRYTNAADFYRATAYSLINKEEYNDLEKYKEDIGKIARRDGYMAGYAEGRWGQLPQSTTISDIYLSH